MNLIQFERPVYLNANLVFSEMVRVHFNKKTNKQSMLERLQNSGYTFIISSLTKMEVLKKFVKEKSVHLSKVRALLQRIIQKYTMVLCSSVSNYVSLTDDLLDTIAKTPIDFTDALHILLAKKLRVMLVTHDKKMLNSYSTHNGKIKLYDLVFKPQDLL